MWHTYTTPVYEYTNTQVQYSYMYMDIRILLHLPRTLTKNNIMSTYNSIRMVYPIDFCCYIYINFRLLKLTKQFPPKFLSRTHFHFIARGLLQNIHVHYMLAYTVNTSNLHVKFILVQYLSVLVKQYENEYAEE